MFDGAETGGEAGTSETEISEPEVVYGKASEDVEDTGQVGADESGEDDELTPEEEFETLIKGQYKAQFDNRVQGILNDRFKNSNDYQQQVDEFTDATALLFAKYGLEEGDIKGLKNAIENDDGIYNFEAEADGLTPDKYKENLRLRMEAAKGRAIMEEVNAQRQREATFKRWDSEGEALKETFPSFDFDLECQNEAFVEALSRVGNVRDAFFIAHMEEIMSGVMSNAKDTAQKETVDKFKARSKRPAENATHKAPAVVRKTDPSKFTDEDLEEVAKRAARGEIISF